MIINFQFYFHFRSNSSIAKIKLVPILTGWILFNIFSRVFLQGATWVQSAWDSSHCLEIDPDIHTRAPYITSHPLACRIKTSAAPELSLIIDQPACNIHHSPLNLYEGVSESNLEILAQSFYIRVGEENGPKQLMVASKIAREGTQSSSP